MAILKTENIRKSYTLDHKPFIVLDDISFSVEQGEVVVLVGKSGCGKSTLLRILAGLVKPDSGTVLLEGNPLTAPTPQVGILFQSYAVFPWMSVQANPCALSELNVARTCSTTPRAGPATAARADDRCLLKQNRSAEISQKVRSDRDS